MASWYYFGCVRESGHFLHDERLQRGYGGFQKAFNKFDGSLCGPQADGLYVAALTRLGPLGYSALAFWDCTIDTRPGSNSIFFAPSLMIHPKALWASATRKFPTITSRFPRVDLSKAIAQHEAIIGPHQASAEAA